MKTSKCKNCGESFVKTNPLISYCSQKCYDERNGKKTTKVCARNGCTNEFQPLLSTQKYCSSNCYHQESKTGLKPKNTKIKKVSDKQAKYNKRYSHLRKAFLLDPKNQRCCKYPHLRATTVHHMMGRSINVYADDWAMQHDLPLLLDMRYWKAASMEGHEWIEKNPVEAKKLGFSLDRLKKNEIS